MVATEPRVARTAVALAALLALLVGSPAPLRAHLALRSSSPAAGAELSRVPDVVRLEFTQPVELAFSRVTLSGPGGEVALGDLAVAPDAPTALVVPVRGALAAGRYTVRWQAAGPDGHPIRGELSFEVLPDAQGLAPAATPAGPPSVQPEPFPPASQPSSGATDGASRFEAGSPLFAAVRWLNFAGLLAAIGAAAFRFPVLALIRREGADAEEFVLRAARRAADVGLLAVAVLAVALVLRLYAQSLALYGEGAWSGDRIGALLGRSSWGRGWLLQAGGAVLAGLGFATARGGARAGWAAAGLGAVALAFSPALSGHSAAAESPALTILADGLHVLGAGGWLGTLLLVVTVGLPVAWGRGQEARTRVVADLVNAFSPAALAFAALVVLTGVFAAWVHLDGVAALWESEYGRVLLLKLAVLAAVFATGAYNWLRVRPTLGTERAVAHLRRSAAVELAVAVLVLAVTAVLVATPPPTQAGAHHATVTQLDTGGEPE